MSVRNWFYDIFVKDDQILVVVDISGLDPDKLLIGISKKFNSLIVKHELPEEIHEIALPINVDSISNWVCNNGVLSININIKR